MADVQEARQILSVEDVKHKRSLSEYFAFKLASTMNFISKRQNDKHAWNLNGPYKLGEGSTGTDGVFPCIFDMEITGFSYYSGKKGSSGLTTVDIHLLQADGTDNGSIFSTRPSVDSSAGNNTSTIYDQLNANTVANPPGHTMGVLNKTTFNAGDVLRLDLDSAMSDANNFQFTIYFRPR